MGEPEALCLLTSSQIDRARAWQGVGGVGISRGRWRVFERRAAGEGQAQGLHSQPASRWVGPEALHLQQVSGWAGLAALVIASSQFKSS